VAASEGSTLRDSRDEPSLSAVVRLAFESLGAVERECLALAHGGGLNVQEIAAALEQPAADIRRALRAGLLRVSAAANTRPSTQPG
jgi:DNA-directed RNA polymerase specialized sigma24 family protein